MRKEMTAALLALLLALASSQPLQRSLDLAAEVEAVAADMEALDVAAMDNREELRKDGSDLEVDLDAALDATLLDGERERRTKVPEETNNIMCPSKICPMRGSVFAWADMHHAVLSALDHDFPGFREVLMPCYKDLKDSSRPAYCEGSPPSPDVQKSYEHLKNVMHSRMNATLSFFHEFQAKSVNMIQTFTEAYTRWSHKSTEPAKEAVDTGYHGGRDQRQSIIYMCILIGKITTGLTNLITGGLHEVAAAVGTGAYAFLVPLGAYAASLMYQVFNHDRHLLDELESYRTNMLNGLLGYGKQAEYGYQTLPETTSVSMNDLLRLVENKKHFFKKWDTKPNHLVGLMMDIAESELQITHRFGYVLGDSRCWQPKNDCDWLNKAWKNLEIGTNQDFHGQTVRQHMTPLIARNDPQRGNTKHYDVLSNIILQSDHLISEFTDDNDEKRMPGLVAQLANTWNGMNSGYAGEVSTQMNGFMHQTNLRTNDPHWEQMRIRMPKNYKDLDEEHLFFYHWQKAVQELLESQSSSSSSSSSLADSAVSAEISERHGANSPSSNAPSVAPLATLNGDVMMHINLQQPTVAAKPPRHPTDTPSHTWKGQPPDAPSFHLNQGSLNPADLNLGAPGQWPSAGGLSEDSPAATLKHPVTKDNYGRVIAPVLSDMATNVARTLQNQPRLSASSPAASVIEPTLTMPVEAPTFGTLLNSVEEPMIDPPKGLMKEEVLPTPPPAYLQAEAWPKDKARNKQPKFEYHAGPPIPETWRTGHHS